MKTFTLITSNPSKHLEFKVFFNNYGIQIDVDSKTNIYNSDIFLKEETFLLHNGNKIENYEDIMNVETYSILEVFDNNKNKIDEFKSKKIQGYIDLSLREENEEVFGWDDVFVLSSIGITLHKLKQINSKVSGRQEVLASFAQKHLQYKDRLDLNFNKMNKETTMTFDDSVNQFISNNKYINSPSVVKSGFRNLLNHSLYNGAFFRSAKNRREKNYWFPGLNAGIPLVGKSDEIHEITFAVHDLTHFLIPDLLLDIDSKMNKKIYIITRMMSEAISLVLADAWFIHNLKKDTEYDWSKRKIDPLFKDLNLNNRGTLKIVMINMINYVLKGKDSYLFGITNDKEDIKNFKDKYDAFFIEDYKWTFANYDNMNSDISSFENWNKSIKDFKNDLQSVSEIVIKDDKKIVDELIKLYVDKIMYMIDNPIKVNIDSAISESFKKYMIGQMFIFSKYSFLSISKTYQDKILSYMKKEILNAKDISNILDFYKIYINELYKINLIDLDQKMMYEEIYPLFNPSYAFYDKDKSYYKDNINYFYELLDN